MEKKIREKQSICAVLERIESVLNGMVEDANSTIEDTDLTPDENGYVSTWERDRVEDAKARLAAVDIIRAALVKLI